MRENEPVLLVLSVCDGGIILEKGEILCEKCQVGVASNGPIHVDGSRVGDESSHPDEWQDNPMTTKTVKEKVAGRNRSNGPRVKPKEHPPGIGRPEVVCDPLHKPAVKKCLVKDMNDV